MTRAAALAAVVGALLVPGSLPAQSFGGRVGVTNARLNQVTAIDTVVRDGLAISLEGAAGLGPATLAVRYLQGGLSGDDPAQDRGLVEGEALLWIAPARWVAVGAGPHLRARLRDGVSEQRAVYWELRGQGNARLSGDAVMAYGQAWTVLTASYSPSQTLDRGLGLEGGLRLTLGRWPFSATFRYRFERLDLAGGTRRETVEQIALLLGVGRR